MPILNWASMAEMPPTEWYVPDLRRDPSRTSSGPIPHTLGPKWERVRTIGNADGAFNGGIAVCQRVRDGKVAVSKAFKNVPGIGFGSNHWLHEILITRKLDHENVIAFLDAYCNPRAATMYMEPGDLGNLADLKDRMDARGQLLSQVYVLSFMTQLAKALCYIHTGLNNDAAIEAAAAARTGFDRVPGWITILHCDIRSDQLFLKTPRRGTVSATQEWSNKEGAPFLPIVKLGDFGLATFLNPGATEMTHWGERMNMGWRPSEWPKISTKTDVHAIGFLAQYLALDRQSCDTRWQSQPLMKNRTILRIVQECVRRKASDRPSSVGVTSALMIAWDWVRSSGILRSVVGLQKEDFVKVV